MSTRYEECATLLQRPLISDGGIAYSIELDGRLQVFNARLVQSSRPFRRIQTNGVGQHCRWMLSDEALVVARSDGTFFAKSRPAKLFYEGGYRCVFSFVTDDGSDLIVLSGDVSTHVVRVGADDMDEYTMDLGVRCFAGHGPNAANYTLYGQTPLSPGVDSQPMVVLVDATRFRAQRFVPPPPVNLESIVAVLPSGADVVLIGAEMPPPPGMESYDRLDFPLPVDHEAWWALSYTSGDQASSAPICIDGCVFISCAGPKNQERVFFDVQATKLAPDQPGTLRSFDARGVERRHEVSGLSPRSSVYRIQFDPLVGWIGIAQEHSSRKHCILSSKDGMAWSATVVEVEGLV